MVKRMVGYPLGLSALLNVAFSYLLRELTEFRSGVDF